MAGEVERAEELYAGGANCCQAVVIAFCERYGLSENDAGRLARGFGGGLRRGEVCGVASGAVMVLGLAAGPDGLDGPSRKACGERVKEFMQWFEATNGSLLCRELVKAAGGKICTRLIAGAAAKLREMGI